MVRHWNRSFRTGFPLFLEAFKARLDVTLGSLSWWVETMPVSGGWNIVALMSLPIQTVLWLYTQIITPSVSLLSYLVPGRWFSESFWKICNSELPGYYGWKVWHLRHSQQFRPTSETNTRYKITNQTLMRNSDTIWWPSWYKGIQHRNMKYNHTFFATL